MAVAASMVLCIIGLEVLQMGWWYFLNNVGVLLNRTSVLLI